MARNYNGWTIICEGGHITIKRFIAEKSDALGYRSHWAFRLKDCKEFCDKRDAGETIPELYMQSLYA